MEFGEPKSQPEISEIPNENSSYFELPNANPQTVEKFMSHSDYMVAFSGQSRNYCVGIIDMSGSTLIATSLHRTKIMKYYEIFLNTMSKVLSRYDATVIKNGGDSLSYYFPKTVRADKQYGFMSCIECGLDLLEQYDELNMHMEKAGLPQANYRVSADYGQIVMIKSNKSYSIDMVGAPITICSKIIQKCPDNEFVIGHELYDVIKVFNDYTLEEMKGYDLEIGYNYKTYSVVKRT